MDDGVKKKKVEFECFSISLCDYLEGAAITQWTWLFFKVPIEVSIYLQKLNVYTLYLNKWITPIDLLTIPLIV